MLFRSEASEKRALLRALIDSEGEACKNAIIFCNRKSDVDIVAKSLQKYGYDAAPIHGDLDQSQRMRTLDGFREGTLRFLIASDVAARGLDIPAVSHVFNYDVPSHAEDYVHRIGRTGRAGRKGKALTLWTPRDQKYFDAIEKLVQKEVPRIALPEGLAAKIGESSTSVSRSSSSRAPSGSSSSGSSRSSSRSRSRSSERGPRDQSVQEVVAAQDTVVEAPVAAAEAPVKSDDTRAPRGAKSKPDQRNEPRNSENRSENRHTENRSHDRNDRNDRSRDRHDKVVGLGDHLPDFIALSFEQRRAG